MFKGLKGIDLSAEVAGANLGDARLAKRLERLVEQLKDEPSMGLPRAIGDEGQLEAGYRFFNNQRVTPAGILEPHFGQTAARCLALPSVLMLHDTSELSYNSEMDAREGLGVLPQGHRGFLAHVALAVAENRIREPLGVLGFETLLPVKTPPMGTRSEKEKSYQREGPEERKSARWRRLAYATQERLASHPCVIHVADREADSYLLFAGFIEKGLRFVIRSNYDRHLEEGRLRDALNDVPGTFLREVPIQWQRGKKQRRKKGRRPDREARLAQLFVRAGSITIPQPPTAPNTAPSVTLNLVEVYEAEPPEGCEAIRWLLLTSEAIATHADIERVVDIYRARWTIEEFFKALKTGCSIEKRQLTSFDALVNALAVFIPIAWRMLLLRSRAKDEPDAQSVTLTPDELVVLRHYSKRMKSLEEPTNKQILYALAGLGGHLKRNGDPGWQTLAHGCQKFHLLYEGWCAGRAAAQDASRCDQS
jgi:hypothetical protein